MINFKILLQILPVVNWKSSRWFYFWVHLVDRRERLSRTESNNSCQSIVWILLPRRCWSHIRTSRPPLEQNLKIRRFFFFPERFLLICETNKREEEKWIAYLLKDSMKECWLRCLVQERGFQLILKLRVSPSSKLSRSIFDYRPLSP